MRVLLVTSWGVACGISDYGRALKDSVEAADPSIAVVGSVEALDPAWALAQAADYDLVHLNHHDALHTRWTAEHVRALEAKGVPVVVTYHDTRSGELGSENSDKARQLHAAASAFIVHEPVADLLGAIYWRHGVPAAAQNPHQYYTVGSQTIYGYSTPTGITRVECFKAFPQQPVLGTVGFNFPWKNFDRLAQVTAEEGWALVLLSNDATAEDEARWRGLNPSLLCVRAFLGQPTAINYLTGCDATAFMYECANNGTSGAIRQGLAARKPVIARADCRQFRDLLDEPCGVLWITDWDGLRRCLQHTAPTAWDPTVSAFAHRDAWSVRGRQHADLYRRLVAR